MSIIKDARLMYRDIHRHDKIPNHNELRMCRLMVKIDKIDTPEYDSLEELVQAILREGTKNE